MSETVESTAASPADQLREAMTPELLAAIKARASAATPGPWSWRRYSDEDPCLQGARTRIVMSVIRRERLADDPETKSYEDYVRDWETPYVDADGKDGYRRLTDEEVAEHVKKDWLQDPWGGPQYDNRLAFRDHRTNIMEYARNIAGLEHPDAEFMEHARADVDALIAEVERLTAERDQAIAAHARTVDGVLAQGWERVAADGDPTRGEAMQLIDNLDNHHAIARWITDNGGRVVMPGLEAALIVETPTGDAKAELGDWVIRVAPGQFVVAQEVTS